MQCDARTRHKKILLCQPFTHARARLSVAFLASLRVGLDKSPARDDDDDDNGGFLG